MRDHVTIRQTPRGPEALVTTRGGFVHTFRHRSDVAAFAARTAPRFDRLLADFDAAGPTRPASDAPLVTVAETLDMVARLNRGGTR